MTTSIRKTLALVALVALLVPFFARSQSTDQLQQEINQHNAQISALDKEIAEYQKQLDVVAGKKQTLQSTLQQLDLSLKKTAASISATKNKISAIQLEIQQLSGGIAGKQASIETGEAGLGESLRRLNESEMQSPAMHILSFGSFSEMWEDIDRSHTLQSAVQEQITLLAEQKQSLTDTKKEAEGKRAQLLKEQQTLTTQQGSLAATKKTQNELLAQTKSQESAYQAILAQKQAEKVAFEAALFELASKLDYTLDPTRVPPAGSGILRWPLDNVFITQQFGKTSVSGRLYSSGTHDGVDFRASLGTPVRASLTGTVLEVNQGAVQNCQYGKWVLVKHGNGLTTLYAHLSEISVQKGELVPTGRVIGYSGSTGYATGPHLHFTVYLSDAVSLKQYTCKNGRTVTVPIAPINAYMNPLNYL